MQLATADFYVNTGSNQLGDVEAANVTAFLCFEVNRWNWWTLSSDGEKTKHKSFHMWRQQRWRRNWNSKREMLSKHLPSAESPQQYYLRDNKSQQIHFSVDFYLKQKESFCFFSLFLLWKKKVIYIKKSSSIVCVQCPHFFSLSLNS